MARIRGTNDSGETKGFALQEIERGIARLKRRIVEVQAIDPKKTTHEDPSVKSLEQGIRTDILEIFGGRSREYQDHQGLVIWHRAEEFGVGSVFSSREAFAAGILRTVQALESLMQRLEEKRKRLSEFAAARPATSVKAIEVPDIKVSHAREMKASATPELRASPVRELKAIDALELHPRLAEVCLDLYRNGLYANAVFDASKTLINFVKERSGRHDLDGVELVRTVFSRKSPILAFNELRDPSDLDEQEGLLHLFEGVVLAVRNPRGRDAAIDSPERAFEYLALLNLLAQRLQRAKRLRRTLG